jgi:hypothetical protein
MEECNLLHVNNSYTRVEMCSLYLNNTKAKWNLCAEIHYDTNWQWSTGLFLIRTLRIYRHLSSILTNQYINLNNVLLRRNLTVTKIIKSVFLKTVRPQIKQI